MKKVLFHPLFLIGLVIKLILLVVVIAAPVTEWYVPFLQITTETPTVDIWALWLNQGGAPAAFPYGYVMWLVFIPLTLTCKLFGLPLIIGYGVTLLIADISLLLIFTKMHPSRERLLLATYWLSPIVVMASYIMGFNDLIPILFLTLSLYLIRKTKLFFSGLACIAAISAKFSMIIALPYFLIYLWNNRALRQLLPDYLKGLTLGMLVMILPFLLSSAGLNMLVSNPEMSKVYRLGIDFGVDRFIYLVPLVYLLMLYATWRIRRINFELFHAMLGLAFLLVVLMTPSSPGWFVWAVPLLITYQVASGRIAIGLTATLSAFYVLSNVLHATETLTILRELFIFNNELINVHIGSLVKTAMVAIGLVLAVRILRETVHNNDYFRLSRKPFVIGISGDSGAGKDTFVDAISGLFGNHSVTKLSGDDYHLWDRQKPMWQVMTHLNPMANDLEGFSDDLVNLTDGREIQSSHYDHSTGRMSRPLTVKSNNIIIASGLHALYLPILRDCYNLSIYLDIDEDLRRHFKIQRDVGQRGHSLEKVLSSLARRAPDSLRFIRPQVQHANLTLSLQPIHPRILDDVSGKHPLRFKLVVRSYQGLNELSLNRVLIGVCGLHVDMEVNSDTSLVELTIEGETSPDDIAFAAQMTCPRILEFLDVKPDWQGGVLGLMQLITLSHINQALIKRFIK
jgi:uridine kinase